MDTQSIVRRVEGQALSTEIIEPIAPRVDLNIRPATMEDVAFIDRLQKVTTHEVGFLQFKAIEGKIKLGQVLIAEKEVSTRRHGGTEKDQNESISAGSSVTPCLRGEPLGYLIAADRYFKRDEIGYITQINVLPEYRRSLVAGALLQAQFDRSAYGCRLYSCWCAQDLKANEFWEAMGFTAIAFRTGSRTKGKKGADGKKSARIHIFWQKRVRADDTTTSWWYPSQTGGGELREDRLVFPIPPGVSWRDVLPVVLPGEENDRGTDSTGSPQAETQRKKEKKPRAKKVIVAPRKGGLWFASQGVVETSQPTTAIEKKEPLDNARDRKVTIDPRLTKMAREFRDVWTERHAPNILPAPAKHDVRRVIESNQGEITSQMPVNLALPKAA